MVCIVAEHCSHQKLLARVRLLSISHHLLLYREASVGHYHKVTGWRQGRPGCEHRCLQAET